MIVLLDTHILLWWLADDPALSKHARDVVTETAQVYVSAATAWEISIKKKLKKLKFSGNLEQEIEANSFTPLAITISHALAAGALPRHHEDPFDRMLIAQANIEGMKLLTHDSRLARYGGPVMVV